MGAAPPILLAVEDELPIVELLTALAAPLGMQMVAAADGTQALARNASIDLTAKIPHGEGRTYLRQVLLVADHNAYHLGQLVATRKALGDWPSK